MPERVPQAIRNVVMEGTQYFAERQSPWSNLLTCEATAEVARGTTAKIVGSATMRATKTSRRISFAGVQEVLAFAVQGTLFYDSMFVSPSDKRTLYICTRKLYLVHGACPPRFVWGPWTYSRGLTSLFVVDWLHVQQHTSSVHVAYIALLLCIAP